MPDSGEAGESEEPHAPRFAPEEEAALLKESNAQKDAANKFFASSQYSQAIGEYDKALSSCPNYLEYEVAVLKSNISACHLKLSDWNAAIESATAALDALDRLAPPPKKDPEKNDNEPQNESNNNNDVVELEGDDSTIEATLQSLHLTDNRKSDIQRIRSKSLMRRAKANSSLPTWSSLQSAEDDYKILSQTPSLPASDKKIVAAALRELPARISSAKEKEMGEMMGKLKELGNGILRPFGLSTENFNMVKDERTGGYSMNFNSK